jgi:hypothetical protein
VRGRVNPLLPSLPLNCCWPAPSSRLVQIAAERREKEAAKRAGELAGKALEAEKNLVAAVRREAAASKEQVNDRVTKNREGGETEKGKQRREELRWSKGRAGKEALF